MRTTEDELVIHDRAFVVVVRHRLFPKTVTGQRSDCKDREPPRDSQRRLEELAQRFAELGAIGSRFLEGLLAGSRYGKNQAERVLALGADYPRHDVVSALERAVRDGAFSLAAVRRILEARSRPKTPLDALADDHRSYLDGLLEKDPAPPRPTSDYQDLCARNPTMADRSSPRGKTCPRAPNGETTTTARRSLHDDVSAALKALGIPVTQAMLDAALSAAERESLNHLEFLHRLLAGPAEARKQRAVDRRIRAAKFRELTSLEGFDWAFNAKGIDRRTIEQLATCDFVRRCENVVLVGQSGLGKSRILQAIGLTACALGYNVRYATSARLLQEFTAAMADGSDAWMLAAYARLDLLLIDEFGFDRLERRGSGSSQHGLLSPARCTDGPPFDCCGDEY